jgi:hypothetical protein
MEHLLQRDIEDLRYPKSNFERGGVLVALDGIDGLAGNEDEVS